MQVRSSRVILATEQSSHTRAPSSATNVECGPTSNDASAGNQRAATPVISKTQTQIPRPLPRIPLLLSSAPEAPTQGQDQAQEQAQEEAKPLKKSSNWDLKAAFLGSSLTVSGVRLAKMESNLQVRPSEFSSVKTKAVEDARQMQAKVIEVASKAGKDPPKYALLELTGKGSFGRVYKAWVHFLHHVQQFTDNFIERT